MMTRLAKIKHSLWAAAAVMWIWAGVSYAVQTGGSGVTNLDIIPHGPITYRSETGLYHAIVILTPAAAGLGPTAPPLIGCGADNGGEDVATGLQFDTTARRAFFPVNILPCVDTTRDVFLQIFVAAEDDDPFLEGETFNWAFDYRTVSFGTGWEDGTLATESTTYTQAALGAGVECAVSTITFTFPRGDADQSYTIGDGISGALRKVNGGTYSGSPAIGAAVWFLPVIEECLQG